MVQFPSCIFINKLNSLLNAKKTNAGAMLGSRRLSYVVSRDFWVWVGLKGKPWSLILSLQFIKQELNLAPSGQFSWHGGRWLLLTVQNAIYKRKFCNAVKKPFLSLLQSVSHSSLCDGIFINWTSLEGFFFGVNILPYEKAYPLNYLIIIHIICIELWHGVPWTD